MTVFFFSAPLFFLAANAVQIAWGPFPPAAFSVCIAALFLALAALTAALAVRTARGKTGARSRRARAGGAGRMHMPCGRRGADRRSVFSSLI